METFIPMGTVSKGTSMTISLFFIFVFGFSNLDENEEVLIVLPMKLSILASELVIATFNFLSLSFYFSTVSWCWALEINFYAMTVCLSG